MTTQINNKELTPTVIILKNSTRKDAIPQPTDLEIGEAALSLFPGQEALWIKNSNGEVVDIRKPSSSGLWESVFTVFYTRTEFDKAIEEGKIDPNKLYFIKTEKQIWAQGEFFGTDYSPEDLDKIVDERIIILPKGVTKFNPETSSEEISEVFGGGEAFKHTAINISSGKLIAGLGVGLGSVPVSVNTIIEGAENLTLQVGWIFGGNYNYMDITYNYGIFGIKNYLNLPLSEISPRLSTLEEKMEEVEESLCWIEAE